MLKKAIAMSLEEQKYEKHVNRDVYLSDFDLD